MASPVHIAKHGQPTHPQEVVNHRCIEFYDTTNSKPCPWEFRKGNKVFPIKVSGRLNVSDVGTMLGACESGAGIAQILELGSERLIETGRLIVLLPDWSDERFPLYALFPLRHHQPAKVRVFIDFCLEAVGTLAHGVDET